MVLDKPGEGGGGGGMSGADMSFQRQERSGLVLKEWKGREDK